MSRPLKMGLEYFMLDCTMDSKVKLLQAKYGLPGFAIMIKIYQKIYGEHGYYCKWNEDEMQIFMIDNGIHSDDTKLVEAVVDMCIEKGIFDKSIYDSFGVLTSKGIQTRFLIASARRKGIVMERNYVLCDKKDIPDSITVMHVLTKVNVGNNHSSSGVNVNNNPESTVINDDNNRQMKRNEMKRNEMIIEPKGSMSNRKLDYDVIKGFWNRLDGLGNIKGIRTIQGKRLDMVRARLKEYSLEDFEIAINNVKKSDFLQGNNKKSWTITFDWFVRPNNFPKVLEGNYNNNSVSSWEDV